MIWLLYLLVLLNLACIVGLFFFFRRYIQRELAKVEYVRRLEKELQQLLLDVNRSGEEIIQVVENRTVQLQNMLQRHEAQYRQWQQSHEKAAQQNYSLEQYLLRLRELKQDAEENLDSFQIRIRSLQTQLHNDKDTFATQLLESLSSSVEQELLQKIRSEFAVLRQTAQTELAGQYAEILQDLDRIAAEISVSILSKPATAEQGNKGKTVDSGLANETELQYKVLSPQQRAEIEQYLNLGLDSRIISQKTGVALHLVEILASLKG